MTARLATVTSTACTMNTRNTQCFSLGLRSMSSDRPRPARSAIPRAAITEKRWGNRNRCIPGISVHAIPYSGSEAPAASRPQESDVQNQNFAQAGTSPRSARMAPSRGSRPRYSQSSQNNARWLPAGHVPL